MYLHSEEVRPLPAPGAGARAPGAGGRGSRAAGSTAAPAAKPPSTSAAREQASSLSAVLAACGLEPRSLPLALVDPGLLRAMADHVPAPQALALLRSMGVQELGASDVMQVRAWVGGRLPVA